MLLPIAPATGQQLIFLRAAIRSMIETAGVVQTPNDECSRTPMSNNRQWTEEVVVVYCVSTPTSAGLVKRRACAAPSTAELGGGEVQAAPGRMMIWAAHSTALRGGGEVSSVRPRLTG